MDRQSQRLDTVTARLGRPSNRLAALRLRLAGLDQGLQAGMRQALAQRHQHLVPWGPRLLQALQRGTQSQAQRLERASLRLELLDPKLVLQRGYAWLSDAQGQAISSSQQTHAGQAVTATLADGTVDLTVASSIR
jgi:exodeoxyribonuclease VII large subunit